MTKIEKIKHGTGSSKWPFIVVRMPRELFVKIKALAKDATKEAGGKVSRSVVVLRLLERGFKDALRSRRAPKRAVPRKGAKRSQKGKPSHASTRAKPVSNGAQASVQ